jgi:hypothetical protein
LASWGDFGVLPGQFNLVHSICTDPEGRVYVADRESHRVQVFDPEGQYVDQWVNLHRPCGLHLSGGLAYIGQLMSHLDVNAAYPNIGACVSIHDMSGRQLARLGDARPGEAPGQFTTPHGLAIDSHGDIYVGEVSWSGYGRRLPEPRTARSFRLPQARADLLTPIRLHPCANVYAEGWLPRGHPSASSEAHLRESPAIPGPKSAVTKRPPAVFYE